MTGHGRLLLVQRVRAAGWRVVAAAAAAGVSERIAYRWLARYRPTGCPPRRSPRSSAGAANAGRVRAAPAPFGRPVSTVGSVLRRLGLGRLAALDAKPPAIRYQRRAAGERLPIDSKKLGRFAGLGHRVTGDRRHRARGLGWEPLHVAIDDASRLAYTELLPDERARAAPASSPAPPPGSPALASGSSGS